MFWAGPIWLRCTLGKARTGASSLRAILRMATTLPVCGYRVGAPGVQKIQRQFQEDVTFWDFGRGQ
jgi:hypothetical protein